MAARTIKAPWTPEQVDALNAFQSVDYMHPFTCPNLHTAVCECIRPGATPIPSCFRCHGAGAVLVEDRSLRATENGWVCKYCDYQQDWAYEFMLEPWLGPPDFICPRCVFREMAENLIAPHLCPKCHQEKGE